jgi:vancomycin resistance protein VanW
MKYFKLQVRLFIILIEDVFSKHSFCKKVLLNENFENEIIIIQAFKPSATLQNKIHNLTIAAAKINTYTIHPNEVFSFWKIIGAPNESNGFKKGRILKNGILDEEIGGGLCQMSGIFYHASIIAGLCILERHNHTVDIYTDETRFTPLGTDAAVVYGFKDLRVKNNQPFPIKIIAIVNDNFLEIKIASSYKINEQKLYFEISEIENQKTIKVFNENKLLINTSKYNYPT